MPDQINPITGIKEIRACILVTVNIDTDGNDYADLQFLYNSKAVKQRIELIVKRDNLGKGNLFYLKCPVTGIQRRKLFLYNGKFVGVQTIHNAHYLSQVQSRKQRNETKELRKLIKLQRTLKKAQRKYFMKYYSGEPTKNYIKVLMAKDDLKTLW